MIFSPGMFGNRLRGMDVYERADIIHLHWVNSGTLSISEIGKLRKPVVWTLRDIWPFTGGCHIYSGCDRFRQVCGRCPMLGSDADWDLSRLIHWLKRRAYRGNIVPVAISRWMAEIAGTSSLFSGSQIRVIPNSVDTDAFHPVPKPAARQILNLPLDRKIVLAGAHNLGDPNKGFHHLTHAAAVLNRAAYFLLFFGNPPHRPVPQGLPPHRFIGPLHDNISLSVVYSAADVFVAPYENEGFGKTLIEAMACETPVVCFDQGGPRDIVEHQVTGYKARPFEPEHLREGIEWLATTPRYADIASAARARVAERFSLAAIAREYTSVYATLLP